MARFQQQSPYRPSDRNNRNNRNSVIRATAMRRHFSPKGILLLTIGILISLQAYISLVHLHRMRDDTDVSEAGGETEEDRVQTIIEHDNGNGSRVSRGSRLGSLARIGHNFGSIAEEDNKKEEGNSKDDKFSFHGDNDDDDDGDDDDDDNYDSGGDDDGDDGMEKELEYYDDDFGNTDDKEIVDDDNDDDENKQFDGDDYDYGGGDDDDGGDEKETVEEDDVNGDADEKEKVHGDDYDYVGGNDGDGNEKEIVDDDDTDDGDDNDNDEEEKGDGDDDGGDDDDEKIIVGDDDGDDNDDDENNDDDEEKLDHDDYDYGDDVDKKKVGDGDDNGDGLRDDDEKETIDDDENGDDGENKIVGDGDDNAGGDDNNGDDSNDGEMEIVGGGENEFGDGVEEKIDDVGVGDGVEEKIDDFGDDNAGGDSNDAEKEIVRGDGDVYGYGDGDGDDDGDEKEIVSDDNGDGDKRERLDDDKDAGDDNENELVGDENNGHDGGLVDDDKDTVGDNNDDKEETLSKNSDVLLPKAVIAYAVTLTECSENFYSDGAAVLKHSIHLSSYPQNDLSQYGYQMYAFVHPDAAPCSSALEPLGYQVQIKEVPINVSKIKGDFLRDHVYKTGCCGEKEFIKLYSYTLTEHPIVVHLDLDSLILQPLDELFDAMLNENRNSDAESHLTPPADHYRTYTADGSLPVQENVYTMWDKPLPSNIGAFYTRDYNMINVGHKNPGLQGGLLIVKPNLDHFTEYQNIIHEGNFKQGTGWGGRFGGYFGAQQIQGVCAYFYEGVHLDLGVELNRCYYNAMVDSPYGQARDGTNTECKDGMEKCLDCRNVDVELIKSAHFTICHKPWICPSFVYSNSKISGLCKDLHRKWFEVRKDLEEGARSEREKEEETNALDESDTERMALANATGKHRTDTYLGYCKQPGNTGYIPMYTLSSKKLIIDETI